MRSRSQLIRVLQDTNQVAEYTYNGAGQRIKKVTQTETRIFHYDLRGHLIAETNQTGQMLAEYVYLGDQLLSMIKPGELAYYFHNDHLGTPQVLTDDTQAIAWKAVYTPFGEAVPSITTVENPFRFPGQYYDPETGLHYNYFRYYNPQTGRYITPDPIGLEGGINLFVYTNNPVNFVDPFGLQNSAAISAQPGAWQTIGSAAAAAYGAAKTGAAIVAGAITSTAAGVLTLASAIVLGTPSSLAEELDSEAIERQREYVEAKTLSDTPTPPGGNPCSTLSRQIDHAERVIKLYEAWDAKWNQGCHSKKIQDWKQRLQNLKKEHHRRCTQK